MRRFREVKEVRVIDEETRLKEELAEQARREAYRQWGEELDACDTIDDDPWEEHKEEPVETDPLALNSVI
jgi:hypothetical protein